jgi:hypothetical protein
MVAQPSEPVCASMAAQAELWPPPPLPPSPPPVRRTHAVVPEPQPVGTSQAASLPNAAQAASDSQPLLQTPQMQLNDPH